jgi:two-component system, chemotaxis family, protein-glutamate methylesterase/glutaminase
MLPVRVLIVDDSVVIRKLLCDALEANREIQVAGTASSGAIALAQIPQLSPDLVTLDIEMPGLNGIETLTEIRRLYPRLPVIMFSSLTERGAAVTLEALARGASDYLAKPNNTGSLAVAMGQVRTELSAKILSLCRRPPHMPGVAASALGVRRTPGTQPIDVLAIGTSTGGPNALAEVLPRLPRDFPVPVLVVQHMPPLFTRFLADRLNSQSQLEVREAEPGARLEPGHVWIAPGDYHMTTSRQGRQVSLRLNQDPPENSCRPSVDVLFRSVANAFGAGTLGVVMTGMGADGARGAVQIHEAGGEIVVQDEASSVVWGMPGAVVSAGVADRIYPLKRIADEIVRRVMVRSDRPHAMALPNC